MSKALKAIVAAPAALALSASALAGVALPTAAQAQVGRNIVNCDAPGGRQQAGAAIGGIAGALIGSQLADNERVLGAVVGGAAGAAAGSYVGCKQQRDRAAAAYAGYQGANAYVARTNLRVRAAPTTRSAQVGSLQAGETFQVLSSRSGWVEVGYNGQPVGYVSSAYVSPARY
jgi:uncharacterized protein YgiM (DUF1202 family)